MPSLGRDQHIVSARPGGKSLGDEALVVTHLIAVDAVGIRGIDERDTGVERGMNGLDGLRFVGSAFQRHGHGTQPKTTDLDSDNSARLHVAASSRVDWVSLH